MCVCHSSWLESTSPAKTSRTKQIRDIGLRSVSAWPLGRGWQKPCRPSDDSVDQDDATGNIRHRRRHGRDWTDTAIFGQDYIGEVAIYFRSVTCIPICSRYTTAPSALCASRNWTTLVCHTLWPADKPALGTRLSWSCRIILIILKLLCFIMTVFFYYRAIILELTNM